ncbi:GNAT family N-acetyltransferase [Streptomyces montanisoli]|uniref:GNAT family N-acetyltransferase n=1 Tax=Streptomyces montanisoli TaxID=2798581 RepID=A0A940MF81_9ACTN|nr:GNAT family N-acetyltransferase [Streptomyces montanisoli]MBP0460144.1 GNAT family N-acetyltransferase [Streptomyces montanisoli]
MSVEVRQVTESEFADWSRAVSTGFLSPAPLPDEVVASRLSGTDLTRTRGAFDAGRCVGTYRSFPQELTVVGGAVVPSDAISNVTVTASHRRRGLLTRMIGADLAAAKERGEVVATLIAAEYRIYGRYGFGRATRTARWSVDVPRTGLGPGWAGPDDGGRIDLVDADEVRKIGPAFHDRWRVLQPGAIDRDERWWRVNTGQEPSVPPFEEPFYAVYRSAAGEVEGLAAYTVDGRWNEAKQPVNTVTVRRLNATTTAGERALWLFLCSLDWVVGVNAGERAPDDLLPYYLPDPRAARLTGTADYLWLRVLDTVRALEARTYAVDGTLVLDVRDEAGLAGGRYRLDAEPGGATCAPTRESADLTLDVSALGALYLGDETPTRLAALGEVAEERAGALARAESLFHTPRRPWCPDMF